MRFAVLALVFWISLSPARGQAHELAPETQASLRAEIEDMLAWDQRVRYMNTVGTFDPEVADRIGRQLAAMPIERNFAVSDSLKKVAQERLTPAEKDSLKALWHRVDLENIQRLREIVAAHGWPDTTRIGGSSNPFIFLLHTHPDTLEAMLPMLRIEVLEGRMPPRQYAMSVDKSRQIRGEAQLYGTAGVFDPTTRTVGPPQVESIAETNAARREIGLAPLDEYEEVASPSSHR
ncbi:MAG: DUF6624 domain-containing protein [Bacteroidota bacterium]